MENKKYGFSCEPCGYKCNDKNKYGYHLVSYNHLTLIKMKSLELIANDLQIKLDKTNLENANREQELQKEIDKLNSDYIIREIEILEYVDKVNIEKERAESREDRLKNEIVRLELEFERVILREERLNFEKEKERKMKYNLQIGYNDFKNMSFNEQEEPSFNQQMEKLNCK
jgi:hypothetical protein